MQTPQEIFAHSITEIVVMAYNSGTLQLYPMVIMDILVTLDIHAAFNTLTVTHNGRTFTTSVWDSDSEDAQYSSIQNLINMITYTPAV